LLKLRLHSRTIFAPSCHNPAKALSEKCHETGCAQPGYCALYWDCTSGRAASASGVMRWFVAVICLWGWALCITGCGDKTDDAQGAPEEDNAASESASWQPAEPPMQPEEYLAKLDILEQATAEDMPGHYEAAWHALNNRPGTLAHLLYPAVLLRWQELAPEAFFTYTTTHPEWADYKNPHLHLQLELLVECNAEALVAYLERCPPGKRHPLAWVLSGMLDETHPQYSRMQALERGYLFSEPEPQAEKEPTELDKLATLAETDPKSALEGLQAIQAIELDATKVADAWKLACELSETYPKEIGNLLIGWLNTNEKAFFQTTYPYSPFDLNIIAAMKNPFSNEEENPFVSWLRVNPDQLFESLGTLTNPKIRDVLIKKNYRSWNSIDPASSFDHALRHMTESQAKDIVLQESLNAWIYTDQHAALKYYHNLESPSPSLAKTLYGAWLSLNPEEAIPDLSEYAAQRPHLLDSSEYTLRYAIQKWFKQDKAACVAWVEDMPTGRLKDHYLLGLIDAFYRDQTSTSRLIEQMDSNEFKNLAAKSIVSYMQKNPSDALAFINALSDNYDNISLYADVIDSWADKDQKAAMDAFPYDASYAVQQAHIRALIKPAIGSHPEYIINWKESLPMPVRREANSLIANCIFSNAAPLEKVRYLNSIPQSEVAADTLTRTATEWATYDPYSALKWAEGFIDPSTQQTGIDNALREALDRDPDAAYRWYQSIEQDGKMMQLAAESFSNYYSEREPLAALQWAVKIQDERTFLASLESVKKNHNQDQISRLVKEVALSTYFNEEDKQAIIERLK